MRIINEMDWWRASRLIECNDAIRCETFECWKHSLRGSNNRQAKWTIQEKSQAARHRKKKLPSAQRQRLLSDKANFLSQTCVISAAKWKATSREIRYKKQQPSFHPANATHGSIMTSCQILNWRMHYSQPCNGAALLETAWSAWHKRHEQRILVWTDWF